MNQAVISTVRRLLAILLCLAFASPRQCMAQVYERMFSFTDARADDLANSPNKGAGPAAGLAQGTDGHFYGTTRDGGAAGHGTAFRMTRDGLLTTLVEFTGNGTAKKGRWPNGLVQASDGNFYGTTISGGAFNYDPVNDQYGYGTVFKMTAGGMLTTLVEFTGNGTTNKGAYAPAGLVQGSDGNFYGTTRGGGAFNYDPVNSRYGYGTIFKMTAGGMLTTLVEFTGNGTTNKGAYPHAGLVEGRDGNFYGTTRGGGAFDYDPVNGRYGYGTVFKMTPAGALTTLVEFTGNGVNNKGSAPNAGLVQGNDGNFYGTTAGSGWGTVFVMTPGGALTTLADFPYNANPNAALVQGSDGNFYGTTQYGTEVPSPPNPFDPLGFGTVFQITPAGALTILVVFSGNGTTNKGAFPIAGLTQGSDGCFYGATQNGGPFFDGPLAGFQRQYGYGTVFKMTAGGVLTTLVGFSGNGSSDKGSNPAAGLAQGGDGNFYGTTSQGGASDFGTVFKLTAGAALTTTMEFTDSGGPNKLIEGSDGTLYGTTAWGGGSYSGTVFKITRAGLLTTLVEFTGNGAINKGAGLHAGLVQGRDGNFYGTTSEGGAFGQDPDINRYGFGTVFKMTAEGILTTLVEFTGNGTSNKGSFPYAGLVQGRDGDFYGTTPYGGASDFGTVFRMTPGGNLTTLVEFSESDAIHEGAFPYAGLVEGSDGNFYGTTSGVWGFIAEFNPGTVFKITPAGVLTTLVKFTGNGALNKGANPYAGLVEGSDGNFYGTTRYGGAFDNGTVFRMTPAGMLTTLVEFVTSGEGRPMAELIRGTDGNLYGTAGGPDGSIYRLLFPGPPLVADPKATLQSSVSAVVEVKVNARGGATTVYLEYGTDGVGFPNTIPVLMNLTGFQTRLAGTTLAPLAPGTSYFYRFRGANSHGTTLSEMASFATLAEPVVTVRPASEIAPGSARFNGTVNARNFDTTVVFEWGADGNTFQNTAPGVPPMVTGNTDVPVSVAVAGLVKGVTYFYRIVATNAAGIIVSGSQSFTTLTDPTAALAPPTAITSQGARLNGFVNAHGASASVVFEYGSDSINFPNSVGATPSTVTGDADTAVSAILNGLTQGATYYYRLKATSAGGVGLSSVASLALDILSGFTQIFPVAPPAAQGFIVVTLTPDNIDAGWRFMGEQQWRAPGVPVGGLATGDRVIEFRPVPGFIHPPQETVGVISGEAATFVDRIYYETPTAGRGGLSVVLKPESLAGAQWRLLGEDDTRWRDSGAELTDLIPGNYLVECKAVAGRSTPPPGSIFVQDNQTRAITLTYFLADAPVGTAPAVLPFETVSTSENLPYAWVGQIRSNVGSGTGFVVKPRVVATAGHVVWDDGTLSAATGLQWLFQRDRGTYEPKPQIPRGFYLFDGYAAARSAPGVIPGEGTVASQNLDVAALYFVADSATNDPNFPGRGGFSGYLASDTLTNEFLLSSAQKLLVGYPVDGIAPAFQGRMHATPPLVGDPPHVANFTQAFGRTYTTTDIRSSGGNSGGPLCVQFEAGNYYPAAIYLGGSAQTVVRAIDSAVIDLFNRAEVSGNGGANNTGGGITHTDVATFGSATQPGALKVIIEPAAARAGGAGWRLSPETSYRLSDAQKSGLTPGTYTLQFSTVNGFLPPTSQAIQITGGQVTTITFTHAPTVPPLDAWRFANFGTTINDGPAADTADPDGDGMNNLAEFAAGTNPNSAADKFKLLSTGRTGSSFTATAAGRIGRTYTLERSAALNAGSWATVASQASLAADGPVTLTDPAAPAQAAFYRIRVSVP